MKPNTKSDIDIEKFKLPLESLKRVHRQFVELRSWFTNTSLASLAFIITILVQIRLDGPIPNSELAAFSVGSLILSAVSAVFSRFNHELTNLHADTKELGKILPLLLDLNRKSEEISEQERARNIELLEEAISNKEEFETEARESPPRREIANFVVTAIALVSGLGTFCAYIWLYLF